MSAEATSSARAMRRVIPILEVAAQTELLSVFGLCYVA